MIRDSVQTQSDEQAVAHLQAMGFSRADVERALRDRNGNTREALNVLLGS